MFGDLPFLHLMCVVLLLCGAHTFHDAPHIQFFYSAITSPGILEEGFGKALQDFGQVLSVKRIPRASM